MSFDVIPLNPDQTRSSGLTYPEAVLRQLDRLAYFIPDAIKSKGGLESEEILAIYAGVSILVSMVVPATDKKFEDNVDAELKKVNFSNLKNKASEDRVKELEILLDIFRMTAKEFPRLNLVPPMDEELDMATQEQIDMEFDEKVQREVEKRLKKMEPSEVIPKEEKPKIVKPKQSLEEIVTDEQIEAVL